MSENSNVLASKEWKGVHENFGYYSILKNWAVVLCVHRKKPAISSFIILDPTTLHFHYYILHAIIINVKNVQRSSLLKHSLEIVHNTDFK